jgi:hypothetical protein
MSEWILFLDDERVPTDLVALLPKWEYDLKIVSRLDRFHVARSVNEAKALVNRYGWPSFASFDHDLGHHDGTPLPTGMDFVKWMCEKVLDGDIKINPDFEFIAHSANPVGRDNIRKYLENFLDSQGHYD